MVVLWIARAQRGAEARSFHPEPVPTSRDSEAPKDASVLAEALLAAQRNRLPEDADYRTPWEKQEDGDTLINYELAQVRKSAQNLRALGLMPQRS